MALKDRKVFMRFQFEDWRKHQVFVTEKNQDDARAKAAAKAAYTNRRRAAERRLACTN